MSAMMPRLVTAYGLRFGYATRPPREDRPMMDAAGDCFRWDGGLGGSEDAGQVHLETVGHAFRSSVSTGEVGPEIPALFTNTSMPRSSRTASAMKCCTAALSDMVVTE